MTKNYLMLADAGMDKNGNSRKLYLQVQGGRIVRAWDKNYLPEDLCQQACHCFTIPTTISFYRDCCKMFNI